MAALVLRSVTVSNINIKGDIVAKHPFRCDLACAATDDAGVRVLVSRSASRTDNHSNGATTTTATDDATDNRNQQQQQTPAADTGSVEANAVDVDDDATKAAAASAAAAAQEPTPIQTFTITANTDVARLGDCGHIINLLAEDATPKPQQQHQHHHHHHFAAASAAAAAAGETLHILFATAADSRQFRERIDAARAVDDDAAATTTTTATPPPNGTGAATAKATPSVFSQRTEETSASQYFQFYGYLSQQQNMMQDYIRTSTYQRAIHSNLSDFAGKIVLDVGAGSGILSFFAAEAGARRVYAVEASNMAEHARRLIAANGLAAVIEVIAGKVEEIELPQSVDIIISEPMGYMLYNERMLETFLHAKKWLKPGGKMFPSRADLHVAPFRDDALYMEQYNKANFWCHQTFHGVDLSSLRTAAMKEYFRQPVVDTFDIRCCIAKSVRHSCDFLEADESDLHRIGIPLEFHVLESGTCHGLAFWFDVEFGGSDQKVWLSTAPSEPLTHWYQVRCLLMNPIYVKQGQMIGGQVVLVANKRQSYDVTTELHIEGTSVSSANTMDLKNPYFRYSGGGGGGGTQTMVTTTTAAAATPVPMPMQNGTQQQQQQLGATVVNGGDAYWGHVEQQQQQQQLFQANRNVLTNGNNCTVDLPDIFQKLNNTSHHGQQPNGIADAVPLANIHPGSISSTGQHINGGATLLNDAPHHDHHQLLVQQQQQQQQQQHHQHMLLQVVGQQNGGGTTVDSAANNGGGCSSNNNGLAGLAHSLSGGLSSVSLSGHSVTNGAGVGVIVADAVPHQVVMMQQLFQNTGETVWPHP